MRPAEVNAGGPEEALAGRPKDRRDPGGRWTSLRWLWLGLMMLAGGLVLIWGLSEREAGRRRVQLPSGVTLELLQVEVSSNSWCSVETGWRPMARRLCPDLFEVALMGPELMSRHRDFHESLMVWVRARGKDGQILSAPGATSALGLQARLRIPGWPVAAARAAHVSSGTICWSFSSFPRDAATVPLTLAAAGREVTWPVPVPPKRGGGRGSWGTDEGARTAAVDPVGTIPGQSNPWPQVRRWGRSEVALASVSRRGDGWRVRLTVRGEGDVKPGWLEWRVSAFDPDGNWSVAGLPHRTPMPVLPEWPSPARMWRLAVEGAEYIPAGWVTNLASSGAFHLGVTPRAAAVGVRALVAAGPGAYRITSDGVTLLPPDSATGGARPVVRSVPVTGPQDGAWVVELRTFASGILCVTEPVPDMGPSPTVRLRERPETPDGEDGRIFAAARVTGAVVEPVAIPGTGRPGASGRWQADFVAPVVPAAARRLEVEVVAPWPTLMFPVDRSGLEDGDVR